jgi:hypothetical protein
VSRVVLWIAIAMVSVVSTAVTMARPAQLPAPPPAVRLGGSVVPENADAPGLVVVSPPALLLDDETAMGDSPGTGPATGGSAGDDSGDSPDEPDDDASAETADD